MVKETFFFLMQLNLSDLPRDKLSGQGSAEIRPPMQVSLGIR